MILPNMTLILGMATLLNMALSSEWSNIPLFNCKREQLSRVSLKNEYLKWMLSYTTQKRKQRANIIKRYFVRNIKIKRREMKAVQAMVRSKAVNSLYDLSSKYSNLSREEAEFIDLIISAIN